MAKILVLHGLGMNMRGKVQTSVFGTQTLDEYDEQIRQYADELGVEVEIFHSNIEGEVVNKIYDAHESGDIDAALFNPRHTRPGIRESLRQSGRSASRCTRYIYRTRRRAADSRRSRRCAVA